MSNEKETLLKKLSKTLAMTIPVLALSGFVPVANLNINHAIAEGDSEEPVEASPKQIEKEKARKAERKAKKAKKKAEKKSKKDKKKLTKKY